MLACIWPQRKITVYDSFSFTLNQAAFLSSLFGQVSEPLKTPESLYVQSSQPKEPQPFFAQPQKVNGVSIFLGEV